MMVTIPTDKFITPPHVAMMIAAETGQQKKKNQIKFVNPNTGNYERNILNAAELHKNGMPMMRPNIHKNETCIICGSGPTLTDPSVLAEIRHYVENENATIIATKAAIGYMANHGFNVTYAVSMDPGAHIADEEKMPRVPGVTHIIASSSDPAVFEYLKDESVWIFHSATGLANEVQLYDENFEVSECMGGGYNVVNRAISCAQFMGFRKTILAGSDCGWREGSAFYCDGSNNRPGVDMSDDGAVELTDDNGKPNELLARFIDVSRRMAQFNDENMIPDELKQEYESTRKEVIPYFWVTRPDMLASGVAIARLAKKLGHDRFILLGNTLPARLIGKSEDFLTKCANFTG